MALEAQPWGRGTSYALDKQHLLCSIQCERSTRRRMLSHEPSPWGPRLPDHQPHVPPPQPHHPPASLHRAQRWLIPRGQPFELQLYFCGSVVWLWLLSVPGFLVYHPSHLSLSHLIWNLVRTLLSTPLPILQSVSLPLLHALSKDSVIFPCTGTSQQHS